ncbi:MAG: hypothetical protein JST41_05935 [Bacteroidetes bacterium]|nr:hypothetical protein [Bacteroidota bacterium]
MSGRTHRWVSFPGGQYTRWVDRWSDNNDKKFREVFDPHHQLLDPPALPRKRIGFRQQAQKE